MDSKYTSVDQVDDEPLESSKAPLLVRLMRRVRPQPSEYRSETPRRFPRYARIVGNVVLYVLAAWGVFSLFWPLLVANRTRPDGCDCGGSVAEAVSRGCRFDGLAMAWLPAHCRDDELTAEFDAAGDGPDGKWTYWADREHTVELSVEQVAAMGDDESARVHMSARWHAVHCLFYWRKQFRAGRVAGKMVEPRSDSEGHIEHCAQVLQEAERGTISGVALNTNGE